MKKLVLAMFLTVASANAFAECKNHFSSAELAKKRIAELQVNASAARFTIEALIAVPGNGASDPCYNGNDRFYILKDGRELNEGDVSGAAG